MTLLIKSSLSPQFRRPCHGGISDDGDSGGDGGGDDDDDEDRENHF